jgi:subtilase family serine protease
VGEPATASWTIVRALPDLLITAFFANSITVTNRGTATAPANVLTITLVGTFTVPSLAPGASITFRWTTCQNGTYTAIVDRTNVVTESDEKNNTASRVNTCTIP